jgi:Cu/Ag efflux protein CusF
VALAALFGLTGGATVWADTDKTMTEGVVRKIDPDNRKVTIKHGEIKNLDMPGMTMVFRLESALDVQSLKPGDKVLFHAEKIDGAFVITDLQNTP